MLTPTLQSASDLLNKLERELWRTFHHRHPTHKADHFYNFCITAHAMKDHFFEAKQFVSNNANNFRNEYHQKWNQVPQIIATTEIANSVKHFVLRDKTKAPKALKTRSVSPSASCVFHIFKTQNGEIRMVEEADAADMSILFADGQSEGLYEFMDSVVKYWRDFLTSEAIDLTIQTKSELYGE